MRIIGMVAAFTFYHMLRLVAGLLVIIMFCHATDAPALVSPIMGGVWGWVYSRFFLHPPGVKR